MVMFDRRNRSLIYTLQSKWESSLSLDETKKLIKAWNIMPSLQQKKALE